MSISTDEQRPSRLSQMVNAEWLMAQNFPPTQYVVPGIIPEGLTLLVAAPKIGKSWMVLGLGVACASGGYALGHVKVDQRPVLYLALEDGHRRLQSRLRSLDVTRPPAGLHFLTHVANGGILDTIWEFMNEHRHAAPLVVLDTLGKAMPPSLGNETQYNRDYRVTGALKGLADAVPGSSLILVHHTRKAEGADFLDAVSGTQGIAGAADTIAVLRRDRNEQGAILNVTSRDAKEGEYALILDDCGNWEINGTTLEEAAAAANTEHATAGVGDRMAEIIATVNRYPQGVRRKDLAGLLHMDDAQLGKYLRRAYDSGRISNPSRGLYTPVTSVISDTFEIPEHDTSDRYDTPPLGETA